MSDERTVPIPLAVLMLLWDVLLPEERWTTNGRDLILYSCDPTSGRSIKLTFEAREYRS